MSLPARLIAQAREQVIGEIEGYGRLIGRVLLEWLLQSVGVLQQGE
jgi:hypothetical protein